MDINSPSKLVKCTQMAQRNQSNSVEKEMVQVLKRTNSSASRAFCSSLKGQVQWKELKEHLAVSLKVHQSELNQWHSQAVQIMSQTLCIFTLSDPSQNFLNSHYRENLPEKAFQSHSTGKQSKTEEASHRPISGLWVSKSKSPVFWQDSSDPGNSCKAIRWLRTVNTSVKMKQAFQ